MIASYAAILNKRSEMARPGGRAHSLGVAARTDGAQTKLPLNVCRVRHRRAGGNNYEVTCLRIRGFGRWVEISVASERIVIGFLQIADLRCPTGANHNFLNTLVSPVTIIFVLD